MGSSRSSNWRGCGHSSSIGIAASWGTDYLPSGHVGAKLGLRMDFDPEILVRLHWRGQPMQWLATRVTYPEDGLSHFRLWQDNWLISRMHARLFFGMLCRAPALLYRRLQADRR